VGLGPRNDSLRVITLMKTRIQDAARERSLLGDGAMGTQLMLAGLEQGNCGEAWNLTHPERVLAIQRRYAEAGSDCILTNTFGGSRIMLNRHSNADKVVEINRAGVEIAREAFQWGRFPTSPGQVGNLPHGYNGYVIGDIGPFGGLMEPYGDFSESQVREAFEEQAKALVDAGADAIIIETQTSLEELLLGIRAAKEAGASCIIGSMAYDVTLDGSTFRTMMGVDPERAAEFMQAHGADIVALNCGTGMDMERARQAVERYKKVTDLPVMVQPNAGQPKLVNMKVVYDETPEQMVCGLEPLLEAGANIVGACCGSTPEHIRAFRAAMNRSAATQYENQAL
jgi:5-methyltetrahydrofolate--homocysteine methyltransferase